MTNEPALGVPVGVRDCLVALKVPSVSVYRLSRHWRAPPPTVRSAASATDVEVDGRASGGAEPGVDPAICSASASRRELWKIELVNSDIRLVRRVHVPVSAPEAGVWLMSAGARVPATPDLSIRVGAAVPLAQMNEHSVTEDYPPTSLGLSRSFTA